MTTPSAIADAGPHLEDYIRRGWHGDMAWMPETAKRRKDPTALWDEVQSIIMVGMNYGPTINPLTGLQHADKGMISVYAQNRDYHDVMKGRLKQIAGQLVARAGGDVKVFVDTAPVMEKPLAAAAGLGWQGKHTNLVSKQFGSWLFLGAIFTTLDLDPNVRESDRCGSCQNCLDVCPTDAFPAPYQLDARRCISYLTIEHAGPIPFELRPGIGNHIYGCDDCLAVCPWNKFARAASESKLVARPDRVLPALADLAQLDDAEFRSMFSGSPVKRIGRDRLIRNVLIAIGNSKDSMLIPTARNLIDDPAPIVRGAAIWALSQLMDPGAFRSLAEGKKPLENDGDVVREWQQAST